MNGLVWKLPKWSPRVFEIYAHENGCPWDEKSCSLAAENGHLECLKYAHEKTGVLGIY